jgi:hypothetical protein
MTEAAEAPRFGPILAFWMTLVVVLNGALWLSGFRSTTLSIAVEQGAARAESQGIGEVSDDLIRKTIHTQHASLPFWTTLALLTDFLGEPIAIAARALAVATIFAALAALSGRPIHYELALAETAAAQGLWVLGLAVRVGLMIALRRSDIETSFALAFPPGPYSATLWLALRQTDIFALIGWAAMAIGGWRRGQMNLVNAITVCGLLALGEAALRVTLGLVIGSGMRLAILPR